MDLFRLIMNLSLKSLANHTSLWNSIADNEATSHPKSLIRCRFMIWYNNSSLVLDSAILKNLCTSLNAVVSLLYNLTNPVWSFIMQFSIICLLEIPIASLWMDENFIEFLTTVHVFYLFIFTTQMMKLYVLLICGALWSFWKLMNVWLVSEWISDCFYILRAQFIYLFIVIRSTLFLIRKIL